MTRTHETELDVNFGKAGERQFDLVVEWEWDAGSVRIISVTGYLLKFDIKTHRPVRSGDPIDMREVVCLSSLKEEIESEEEQARDYIRDAANRDRVYATHVGEAAQ